MAERRLPTQRDITRALKAAKAAGFLEPRVEIEPDGKLVIITAPEKAAEGTPLDKWLAEHVD